MRFIPEPCQDGLDLPGPPASLARRLFNRDKSSIWFMERRGTGQRAKKEGLRRYEAGADPRVSVFACLPGWHR